MNLMSAKDKGSFYKVQRRHR